MTVRNAIASLAVKDLKAASSWYERLLGRAPDSTPMPEVAEWRFERGGWLQVYRRDDERAGMGSATLAVADLDGEVERLKHLGIDIGLSMSGDKAKVAMIRDPDGNSIAFAQALDPGMAR